MTKYSGERLGRALGSRLSVIDNLHAVYLPEGVMVSTAEALVRQANESRPAEPPFAILMTASRPSDPMTATVWPAEDVIKYRQGDRLLTVLGRHTDLQSIETSFGELLGLSYPQDDSGELALDKVAETIVENLLLETGVVAADSIGLIVARMASCLRQLRDIYLFSRNSENAWNAQWFRHVTIGLERLATVLAEKSVVDPSLDLADFFDQFLFAAFSLPRPDKTHELWPSSLGRAFAAALDDYWLEESRILVTVAQLRHHPETIGEEGHPLEKLDWSGFDRDSSAEGGQAIALMGGCSPVLSVVEAFASLTPQQFFNPTATSRDERKLVVEGADGEDLSASEDREAGPFVLTTSDQGGGYLVSQDTRIVVPVLSPFIDESTLGRSGVTVRVSPASLEWRGQLEVGPQGQLWLAGNFVRQAKGKKPKGFISATVSITVPPQDVLSGAILGGATCAVQLVPPDTSCLLAYRRTSTGALGKAIYLGPETLSGFGDVNEVLEQPYRADYPDIGEYQVLVFSRSDARAALHNGHSLNLLKGRDGVYSTKVQVGTVDSFESGAGSFELRSPEPTTNVQSPIVAALSNQAVSQEGPNEETVASFRGLYEKHLAQSLDEPDWRFTMGHVAVLTDRETFPFSDLSYGADETGMLMHADTRQLWRALSNEGVPRELLESPEAEEFRSAFEALGASAAMTRGGAEASEQLDWPSRTSWRHLWEAGRGALDRYLAAYSALLRKSKKLGDPNGVFWAAYPFSVSLWSSQGSLDCTAVLLSPLHPLRLAWLASVESTLWESADPGSLAGTIEGWNIPVFGPRQSSAGRMLAIPMDSGEGQVFLGWSMLVGASIEAERPLVPPNKIGRHAAPGTAASGLNATGATSALRSFRRMYPHISTLTVDLAAETQTSRLDEVDQAVLSQLNSWSSERIGQFRGGARVLDSLRRGGEIPAAAVAALAQNNLDLPVLWSRYEPNPVASETCNIRLLQDAGVRISISVSTESNRGILGKVPLRRFEAATAPVAGAPTATSQPALSGMGVANGVFAEALGLLESSEERPQIRSKLHHAALVDGRADWTVAGESLVSPAAMAALVSGGSQMLWEWRPPFLESEAGIPVLERRPFVSIARVPNGFKERLKQLLAKVTGATPDEKAISSLLGKLGARGVGLSSLLAMGGTHAAGALGFYLGFSLADHSAEALDADQFALPIDACDTFLKALAGTHKHAESTRRADLLILSLNDQALSLVPVEIKFYGLETAIASGALPIPGDSSLNEALQQLESTMDLLRAVEEKQAQVAANANEGALWRNALATLVEAGARLKPAGSTTSASLPNRFQKVVDGTIPVRVGRPIVLYFKHEAVSKNGAAFEVHKVELVDEISLGAELRKTGFGALVSGSGHAFQESNVEGSGIARSWTQLLQWSIGLQPIDDLADAHQNKTQVEAASRNGESLEAGDIASGPIQRVPSQLSSLTSPENLQSEASKPAEKKFEADQKDRMAGAASSKLNDGIRFSVGKIQNSIGDADAIYWPGNTELTQMNIGVVGDLGTGKTQLLLALVAQLRKQAEATQANSLSFLILDYKGDFKTPEFLERVGGKLLKPNRIPLNIFALPGNYSPLAAFQRASSFCDVLEKIYKGVGPVQRNRLRGAITDLYRELDGKAPTIREVYERYVDGGTFDSVSSILQTFVYGEVFSDDRDELLSFEQLIENRVLVVALDEFGTDQESKNALVALFLNLYYDFMLKSQKWPFEGTEPQIRRLNSFLLVDEASNIMGYNFEVLMSLLLQGREFGFGTILGSQYLSHFKPSGGGPNYAEPLLTWFVHRVPTVAMKELEQIGIPGATADSAAKIAKLKVHEAYYSSYEFPGRFITGTPYYKLEER